MGPFKYVYFKVCILIFLKSARKSSTCAIEPRETNHTRLDFLKYTVEKI